MAAVQQPQEEEKRPRFQSSPVASQRKTSSASDEDASTSTAGALSTVGAPTVDSSLSSPTGPAAGSGGSTSGNPVSPAAVTPALPPGLAPGLAPAPCGPAPPLPAHMHNTAAPGYLQDAFKMIRADEQAALASPVALPRGGPWSGALSPLQAAAMPSVPVSPVAMPSVPMPSVPMPSVPMPSVPMPSVPMSPVAMSPVPMSPVAMSPVAMSPVPMSPVPMSPGAFPPPTETRSSRTSSHLSAVAYGSPPLPGAPHYQQHAFEAQAPHYQGLTGAGGGFVSATSAYPAAASAHLQHHGAYAPSPSALPVPHGYPSPHDSESPLQPRAPAAAPVNAAHLSSQFGGYAPERVAGLPPLPVATAPPTAMPQAGYSPVHMPAAFSGAAPVPGYDRAAAGYDRAAAGYDRAAAGYGAAPSHGDSSPPRRNVAKAGTLDTNKVSPHEFVARAANLGITLSPDVLPPHIVEQNVVKIDLQQIFVGGLPANANEGHLSQLFGKFGRVGLVDLCWDQATQRHRGYCFVVFDDLDGAIRALNVFGQHQVLGKWVDVQPRICDGVKGKGHTKGKGRGAGQWQQAGEPGTAAGGKGGRYNGGGQPGNHSAASSGALKGKGGGKGGWEWAEGDRCSAWGQP